MNVKYFIKRKVALSKQNKMESYYTGRQDCGSQSLALDVVLIPVEPLQDADDILRRVALILGILEQSWLIARVGQK